MIVATITSHSSSSSSISSNCSKSNSIMSNVDMKALVAVLFTIFSLLYMGTYYIDDLSLESDLLMTKESFLGLYKLGEIKAFHSQSASDVSLPPVQTQPDIDAQIASQLQPPFSKYAYTTLLHGIDNSYRYRGFLYNTIIFKKLLTKFGSTADVIAMIGFANGQKEALFEDDINLLKSFGIKIYYLPRMDKDAKKVSFGEMALLKITPWSFVQYEAVQYIDADVMPKKSLDMYFSLKRNSFHTGSASPVNSGWFLAIPNIAHYNALWDLAVSRLQSPWDINEGWGAKLPDKLPYRGGYKFVKDWNFNGASLDQGLFTYYFVLTNGEVQLFDMKEVRVYDKEFQLVSANNIAIDLASCGSKVPMDSFAHFTGRNKPWLKGPEERKGPDVKLWFATLDSLKLPMNSANPQLQDAKSPLGYFHANK
jgi:hypothetical protein